MILFAKPLGALLETIIYCPKIAVREIDVVSFLTTTLPPWLLRTAIPTAELKRILCPLDADTTFTNCIIDASNMTTVQGVFEEFSTALNFPAYFGFNGNAFDECLADLTWLEAQGICVCVMNSEVLLADQLNEISWLIELLNAILTEWSVSLDRGKPWDRAAIPFHVVFHSSVHSSHCLPTEIANLPLLEQQDSIN